MPRWAFAACALVICTCVRAQISVDETATRARLVNGSTTVTVAIQNALSTPAEGRVDLEWLDPDGVALIQGHAVATFPPGNSPVDVKLGLPRQRDPLFLRLRYRLMPTAPKLTGFFYPAQGTVSFSHIAEHAFILTAAPIGTPRVGSKYELRVFSSNPISGKPVPGVAVEGAEQKATTNADGAAILRLTPDAEEWKEPDTVAIEGSLGDLVQHIDANIPALPPAEIRIQTDKPLYQPGQKLHVRLLALGSDKHAHTDASYSIHIRDEHETVVHTADVQTSRFGIASTDWEIPPNAAAGKYRIEVEGEDDERASRQVEIRKYELPSFRVAVQPDRAFYLPGQNATIEVRADYLFGKPVQNGQVRISEADEDDQGEALKEGPLDANARFQAVLDLTEAAKQIQASAPFVDLHYTAYVTEAATHRTEQRKFDLRISRAPIHIYVVRAELSEVSRPIYVTTYTPDGQPTQCDLEVLKDGVKLGAGRSNRLGVARIDAALREGEIVIRARDSDGAISEVTQLINGEAPHVRLDTDRVLYRAGQPVECDITADRPDLHVTLLARREERVLFSSSLRLKNGRAHVRIPYDPLFGRVLSLQAMAAAGESFQVARTVLYPGPDDLRVAVHPGAPGYKPGEQATLALRAESAANTPVETAFGISVVDQSVLERADTDRALVRRRWFDYSGDSEPKVGGIAWSDLVQLDPKKIDNDLELVAESLQPDSVPTNSDNTFLDNQRSKFSRAVSKPLEEIKALLDQNYLATLKYPMNEIEFEGIARRRTVLDPWQRPYQPKFSIEGANHVLRLISAGPDKQYDTEDDIVGLVVQRGWFTPAKLLIGQALEPLTDFPASVDAFYATLAGAGVNLAAMHDPWGNTLRPEISYMMRNRYIKLYSPGPDHQFGTSDDVLVAQWKGNYFQARTNEIQEILDNEKEFPATEAAVYAVLRAAGLDLHAERDPWRHPYYLAIGIDSRIRDRMQIYTYSDYSSATEQRKQVTQVTQKFLRIDIRSVGQDGVQDTYDDFSIAEFSRALDDNQPGPAPSPHHPPVSLGGTGVITGLITDASGAVIADAEISLNNIYATKTDSGGRYYFRGVRPGTYTLRFSSPGFQLHITQNVPVRAEHVTRVDAVLQVGLVSQTVSVAAAEALPLQTSMAMVSRVSPASIATPRVREYFPETLYWQPELISDPDGRAHLNFKSADNITTWHVAVTASTADGHVSEAETEVRAFQPFFVDLDPPQVLTAGDEIALPVPIRNYLATDESVAVDVAAPASLAILDAPKRVERIAASSSVSPAIRMRASAAPAAAKLRVTARTTGAADAIEKTISIHPDGEPMSQAVTDLLENGKSLRIEVPANAIAGSIHAEVKFYPTLLANLIESMESILTRPYGCGEQTISSSYPNLLFLRALKKAGLKNERLEQRACRNLEKGYQRLLGYRSDGGGFSYWALSPPDAALTSYAIAFLEDATEFIPVEEAAINDAAEWLQRQKPESFAIGSLSVSALARAHQAQSRASLNELLRQVPNMDDPYAVAQFALAAMDSNRTELAPAAIARLRSLARSEQNMSYWPLAANTPYHGWGRAGAIEATALAVTALTRWYKQSGGDPELKSLVDHGVLYLLRGKDESGLWLSSQATVRVLFALLEAFAPVDSRASRLP